MIEKDFLKKWDAIGFLDNVPIEQKLDIALLFEELSQYLIEETEYDYRWDIIFPVIIKVRLKNKNFKLKDFVNDYFNIYGDTEKLIKKLYNNCKIDIEFEMVSLLSQLMIERYYKK